MLHTLLNSPYWIEFTALAVAHLVAVASPGPDFAVVSRYSVRCGARIGVWVSLGIALGILIHVTYSVLGLALVVQATPILYGGLLLVAAGYFLWLASILLRAKKSQEAMPTTQQSAQTQAPSVPRAIGLGFLTNGLNMKATMFFLALFTSIVSVETPLVVKSLYGGYLAMATFVWFAALSLLLGKTPLRGWLYAYGHWLDRVMGLIVFILAMHLLWQWYALTFL
ncbi:lysine transporter LysE [Aliidiomarina taiwanensis]|uniref:Lysine transporter LysE n=1 Tax=Aliidiomarina taiwanensis TaxID=946228 RepID=A0A432X9W6_9GAMM|nr:LysE family transporter [Aliidiomarina taiwanensis]RUO44106.1 lysine transporter LysE [Aliidiomarina taiwanensis]